MRLKSIELEAFRAFGAVTRIELDAEVVLLSGRNGFGKTSVFDGISWCLFGSSNRFGGSRDYTRAGANFITNGFRTAADERVRLVIGNDQRDVVAERTGSTLVVEVGNDHYEGATAQRALLELLGFGVDPVESLTKLQKRSSQSFGRSFLLYQDLLSEFVKSEAPRERFDAFASLLFLSPIRDFYTHLSSEHSLACQRREATLGNLKSEVTHLKVLQSQLEAEEARIQQLSSGVVPVPVERAAQRLLELLAGVAFIVANFSSGSEKPLDNLDKATLALTQFTTRADKRLSQLRELRESVPLLSAWEQQVQRAQSEMIEAENDLLLRKANLVQTESELNGLQESLAIVEKKRATDQAANERFGAFLSDALAIVSSDECPVCLRAIDRQVLLDQLRQRLAQVKPEIQEKTLDRQTVKLQIEAAETKRNEAFANVRKIEQLVTSIVAKKRELERSISHLHQRFITETQLQVPVREGQPAIDRLILELEGESQKTVRLRTELEELRPAFQLLDTRHRLAELRDAVDRQTRVVDSFEAQAGTQRKVIDILDKLISASRRAERNIVEELVKKFQDPIRDAYRWLSPHPLFTQLEFELGDRDESGELYFKVNHGPVHMNPATTFSTAQANILALATFLSFNVVQEWSPLKVLLMDDPIQNLDDVNILSLVDLIRRTNLTRQVIISTSSASLHRLLRDKLRPRKEGQRLISHNFEALSEDGPRITPQEYGYLPHQHILPQLRTLSA